ncbi:MAG: methyltransferase domain-containing protein [Clostridia bacterium]|nr:methyltransferase domain-containing protein [Clostridia bacterium]
MFWDKVAGVYDLFGNIYNGKVNREMCWLTAEKISPEDRVLECACGTGMMTVQIAPLCASVTATDYAEGMLKKTREK